MTGEEDFDRFLRLVQEVFFLRLPASQLVLVGGPLLLLLLSMTLVFKLLVNLGLGLADQADVQTPLRRIDCQLAFEN